LWITPKHFQTAGHETETTTHIDEMSPSAREKREDRKRRKEKEKKKYEQKRACVWDTGKSISSEISAYVRVCEWERERVETVRVCVRERVCVCVCMQRQKEKQK